MTTTTPANATASPAARRRENSSRPSPSDITSAIAGAAAMTTLAVPAVVVRSPAFSARWYTATTKSPATTTRSASRRVNPGRPPAATSATANPGAATR